MIQVVCDCGRLLVLQDKAAGTTGFCPDCMRTIEVPEISTLQSEGRPQTMSWRLPAESDGIDLEKVSARDTTLFTGVVRRQAAVPLRSLLVLLGILLAGVAIWGFVSLRQWSQVQDVWTQLDAAVQAPATDGDEKLWETIRVAADAPQAVLERIRQAYAPDLPHALRRRQMILLSYLSSRVPLEDSSVAIFAEEIDSKTLELRMWAATGLALAAYGQAAHDKLLSLSRAGEVRWQHDGTSRLARVVLAGAQPTGTEVTYDRLLAEIRRVALQEAPQAEKTE